MGGEDPLKEEMATHSSISCLESPGQRSLEGYSPWGCKVLHVTEQLSTENIQSLTGLVIPYKYIFNLIISLNPLH